MRVVIVNKFLYNRGGDCICALSTGDILTRRGHEVRYFGMNYVENIQLPGDEYFPDEVSFNATSISARVRSVRRVLFGTDVAKRFDRLLDDFRPDVVHLHNIHSYISPVVAEVAARRGVRVVWTLHDYKLLCPAYSCLRAGTPCEACFTDKFNVVRNRCMKGSLAGSGLAWIEALFWHRERLERVVSKFICPSRFMALKMEQGGFHKDKLCVVGNFVSDDNIRTIDAVSCASERENVYCYVGRLSAEKGVGRLVEVASSLPYKLYIAGSGPLEEHLRAVSAHSDNIVFLGRLNHDAVLELLRRVRFSVCPSVWYENNPFSVIESLCCGTPVLGAAIGGVPELLTDDCCRMYCYDISSQLREAIEEMFTDVSVDNCELSRRSLEKFGADAYYSALMKIYASD